MRNNSVKPDEDHPIGDFVPTASFPLDRRSPEQQATDLNAMLLWMRNGKDDVDDPEGNFKRIDQILPHPKIVLDKLRV
jgi:hypothetical protein